MKNLNMHMLEDDPEVYSNVCTSKSDTGDEVVNDASNVHPLNQLGQHYSSFYRLRRPLHVCLGLGLTYEARFQFRGPIMVPEMENAEKVLVQFVFNRHMLMRLSV